jgi:hypothetical protein
MTTSFIRALAAGALLIVAAGTANAQSAAPSGASASAAATPWAKVPTGVYKLQIQLPDQLMPATVTITDSSSAPAATFQAEGDEVHPVKVTVKDTELFINGDAPKGPFEIVLTRQGTDLTGRWTYGGDTGKLTGKAE